MHRQGGRRAAVFVSVLCMNLGSHGGMLVLIIIVTT